MAGDIRTARKVAKMGSSISGMIQLSWDSPSNHTNGKMAMLNTEVWVEGNKVPTSISGSRWRMIFS